MQDLKVQKLVSNRDLLNKAYAKSLILLMDLRFAQDSFDVSNVKELMSIDNVYIIPREVKYDDFIQSGYDDWLKKNQKPMGMPGQITQKEAKTEKKQSNNHMLVEFHV